MVYDAIYETEKKCNMLVNKVMNGIVIIMAICLLGLYNVGAQTRCYTYDGAGCRIVRDQSCDPTCSTHVTNTNDGGAGSLRKAIECAENGDTITFDPLLTGQVIMLASTPIHINKSINILQTPTSEIYVGGYVRSFQINSGTTKLKNVRLYAECHPWYYGTSIRNYGQLIMDHVTIVQMDDPSCVGPSIYNLGTIDVIGNSQIIKE